MNTISQIRLAFVAIMLVASSFAAKAQMKSEPPVAKEGFWVVETPAKSRQCTVKFYTNDQRLIYEETVNRSLNIKRLQTKRLLNIALEQAMFVWNATHQIPTDRQWVAVRFEKK
ncbi:hypothetical protein [Spirosoma endbachense]|uniref:TonB C-terminal domain-containing protein n=1 Tax=Spirosoma endbachense TaxID=2666025 RepID=A0A6P1WAU1_9BACT|nr:hypothetical protein [Spirosoma endbachense]QHW01090.1 hypothetical protein GJR95_41370 [Spirosoma endbachense]